MRLVRIAGRVGGFVLLFLLCVIPHFISKLLFGRSEWPRRFLGAAGWVAGARVRTLGEPAGPHSLIIANHVSWLDILILGGATGCRFVSKDELGHGFIHWLADLNNTLYVRRSDRKGARDQAVAIASALEGPQPVALFPEGTVGPGDHLLPFRPTLLEAAALAAKDVHIRPVALDYDRATEISWHGESGRDNVLRLLGRRGTIAVTIRLLEALEHGGDRKALAVAARDAVASALTASSSSAPRL
jgi:lyso-ornithine lipid O-acyltransferase